MTTEPTTPTAPSRLPASTLLAGAGGLLVVLGAFLPWVTVGSVFSISGIDAKYGIATLIVGIILLIAAFGAGKVYDASKAKVAATVITVLGALALAVGLYAGFVIRDNIAEANADTSASSTTEGGGELDAAFEDFANEIAEAFKPGTGFGVYATALGGALALGGGLMAAKRR